MPIFLRKFAHVLVRFRQSFSNVFADAAFVISFSSNYGDFQEILNTSEDEICKHLFPPANFDEILLNFAQNVAKVLKNEKLRIATVLIF